MSDCLNQLWQFLKDHDAPNWIAILISLIIWPIILAFVTYWWAYRKRQNVSHFFVTFTSSSISIGQAQHDAILLTFINQTGSVAYLSRARLKEVQKRFPVPKAASRDMAGGWRELTFAIASSPQIFDHHECILQTDVTNGRAIAAIAVATSMNEEFYSYRPRLLRRWFRFPKYFTLEYVVVVGDKKRSVSTVY